MKNNHSVKGHAECILHLPFLLWNGFNPSHSVNNLYEVTKVIISQRRHSHPYPLLLKITENLSAPNTAPKQRRALRFFTINFHFTAVWWMSLCKATAVTPRVLLTAPEELPWRGHLWLSGEVITRKCILSLFAASEAIQQEKQGDIWPPGRFLSGISKGTVNNGLVWATAWELRGHSQWPPPGMGNVKTSWWATAWTPSWATKTTKTEGNYAATLILWKKMGEVEWKISKQSRLQLKPWGCCTQIEEQLSTILGFSPLLFSLHLCRLHQHRPIGFQENFTKSSILHTRNCKLQTNSAKSKRNINIKITSR